jgi:hypothetical protein
MEELEKDLVKLKAENEKLKNENNLLKENTKALIDENRKLLKFKADCLAQQKQVDTKSEINTISNEINNNNNNNQIVSSSLKRKINSLALIGAASDESAVFFNLVSQPKKQQLQSMIQKFICVLILYTVNLINKESNLLKQTIEKRATFPIQFNQDQEMKNYQRQIGMKITKLKVTLLNLIKLFKYYRQKTSNSLSTMRHATTLIKSSPIMKTYLKSPQDMTNLNTCKLIMLVSLMTKLMKKNF